MRRPVVRVGRGAGLATALLIGTTSLTACGSTPTTSPPTGVDEVVAPTPDPDADDFVEAVDNPLFPLADGGTWTYRSPDGAEVVLEVTGSSTVDGVAVTALERTETDADGEVVGVRRSSYAQDRAGNVWSFGREVLTGSGESWEAGVDGAEAGLLVPAEPRRGDGWLQQDASDLRTRVEVLDVAAPVEALGEEVEALHTLDTVEATADSAETAVERWYAPGLGVVRVTDGDSSRLLLELVARD
jgi:hypothetical protein